MSTASFVIGCVALVLSSFSVGWQVFTWRHGRRFDVRARVQHEMVGVGSGVYEIVVVVENHGATTQALQEISLLYSHDDPDEVEHGPYLGPGSVWDRNANGELPPRRNLRFTYDLLAGRYTPFPSEVVAVATLESGEVVRSQPFRTDSESYNMAMAGRLRPAAADREAEIEARKQAEDAG